VVFIGHCRSGVCHLQPQLIFLEPTHLVFLEPTHPLILEPARLFYTFASTNSSTFRCLRRISDGRGIWDNHYAKYLP
jgi:hypothetical protein